MSSAGRSKIKPSETKTSPEVAKVTVGDQKRFKSGLPKSAVARAKIAVDAEAAAKSVATPLEATAPTKVKNQFPSEQYDLPVAYDQSGQILTLRQMLVPGACAVSLSSLAPEKLVELTSKRIAAKPDFEIAMVGAGPVNKARALKEVAAQSDVGRLLVEIEQRVIQRVLNRVMQ